MAFSGPLTIRERDVDTDRWELAEPLTYGSMTIPVGFVCDGATIPWPVSIVFPHWGRRYRRAAILHDYLLSIGTRRTEADKAFLAAMKDCGVSFTVRWTFYYAVGFFSAFKAWRKAIAARFL